jgi:hypothetical protein
MQGLLLPPGGSAADSSARWGAGPLPRPCPCWLTAAGLPPPRSWDPYLTRTEVLAAGRPRSRELLVRWRRSFPLHSLSDREYVIARWGGG